jgi:hypothetical protein
MIELNFCQESITIPSDPAKIMAADGGSPLFFFIREGMN